MGRTVWAPPPSPLTPRPLHTQPVSSGTWQGQQPRPLWRLLPTPVDQFQAAVSGRILEVRGHARVVGGGGSGQRTVHVAPSEALETSVPAELVAGWGGPHSPVSCPQSGGEGHQPPGFLGSKEPRSEPSLEGKPPAPPAPAAATLRRRLRARARRDSAVAAGRQQRASLELRPRLPGKTRSRTVACGGRGLNERAGSVSRRHRVVPAPGSRRRNVLGNSLRVPPLCLLAAAPPPGGR